MRKIVLFALTSLSALVFSDERYDQQVLAEFVNSQQSLNEGITKFCRGSIDYIPTLTWQHAAINWFKVQALKLPATEFLQTDHAYIFWPDAKDGLKKQVTALLPTPPAATQWRDLPASIKSLSAIEFIFTQPNPLQHCDWLKTISAHQVEQAQQFAKLQSFYPFDTYEKINALHASALTAHSHLKDALAREDRVIWQLAPAWRTQTGWSIQLALYQQIFALAEPFNESEINAPAWQQSLSNFHFTPNEPSQDELRHYDETLVAFAAYVENSLAPALDIYLGFNNFDGD